MRSELNTFLAGYQDYAFNKACRDVSNSMHQKYFTYDTIPMFKTKDVILDHHDNQTDIGTNRHNPF
jgi:hypothetical protein